jgi:hypothetical protein
MLTRQQDLSPGSDAPSAHRAERTWHSPVPNPSTVLRDPAAHCQGFGRLRKTTRAKSL